LSVYYIRSLIGHPDGEQRGKVHISGWDFLVEIINSGGVENAAAGFVLSTSFSFFAFSEI